MSHNRVTGLEEYERGEERIMINRLEQQREMEKEQIFYLVTKNISWESTSDEVIRLQNLLQDYLGTFSFPQL